ncbi:MAG: TonB-dependent receptor [Acidobacteriota bacterium]|nr:TonB-dependent receptor [Acidobacteriota bacterium]
MKKYRLPLFLMSLVFLVGGFGGAVRGQGTTSRVTGVVVDPTGAVVPGATVMLTNEATNLSFTTETTDSGVYAFESVQVGTYSVAVEKSGFKKSVSTGIVLSINQPSTVNVTLETGGVDEVVTVEASAELVQTSSSGNFGSTIEQRTLVSLPIVGTRGRNPLQLINGLPGVAVGSNTGGGIHVHGARDRAFNFTLDGIDINETSAGGSNFTPLRTNPDSLAELQIVTSNATAELGRSSGAQVSLITRSGTNDLHGSAFWFYQTPRFHANEHENNTNRIGRRQFVQHIGGFSVGGPVLLPRFGEGGPALYNGRNRTFFFMNMQGLRTTESRSVTSTAYTADARQGIFRYVIGGRNQPALATGASVDTSGNVLSGVRIGTYNVAANDPQRIGFDSATLGLINRTPLPNNFTVGDGLNTAGYTFTAPQQEAQEDFVVKIDHTFNERNAVYVRYAWGRQDTLCDFANSGWQRFPDTPCTVDTTRRPRNLAVNWRTSPTARVTNELVVGFNRFTFSFDNPDPNGETNPPIVLNNVTDPLVSSPRVYNARSLRTYQFVDNFTYLRGAHTYKAGLNFRYQQHIDDRSAVGSAGLLPSADLSTGVNVVDPVAFRLPTDSNVTFDRPQLQRTINDLLGRVGSISQSFVAISDAQYGPAGTRFLFDARYPEYDFYAQDTWKIRPNLTIDYGVRWEIRLSPRGGGDSRIFRPNKPVRVGEAPANDIAFVEGKLYDDDWNNIAPSVGFAWDPFSTGKTSIRANYRLAYDRTNTFIISSSIFQSVPGLTQTVLNQSFGQGAGRVSQGLPVLSPPTGVSPERLRQSVPFSARSITTIDPSMSSPETHQWGISVQREVGWNSVVDLSYIGRRAHNLYGAYNVNQTDIFGNGFLEAFNAVRSACLSSANCTVPANASPLINTLLERDTRRLPSETGSQTVARLFTSALRLGSVGGVAASIAQRDQSGNAPFVLSGFSPFSFQPFPQFAGGWNVIDTNDFSTYHGFEAQVRRRFTNGISLVAGYTLSKSLDTRSFDPAFTVVGTANAQSASSTPFDVRNRKLNYARSDFDRLHSFKATFLVEFPFGRGRRYADDVNGVVNQVIGGWSLAGVTYWLSGRPFTAYSGANTVSNVNQSTANCQGCTPDMGSVFFDSSGGTTFFFTGDERGATFDTVTNTRGIFSVPAPGQLGNTSRNFFTGPPRVNLDLALTKKFRLTESQNLEFRVEAQNVTNTPSFGLPTATITSSLFGRVHDSVVSFSRKMQFGVKYNF